MRGRAGHGREGNPNSPPRRNRPRGRGFDVQGQSDDRGLFGAEPGGSIGWKLYDDGNAKAPRSPATGRSTVTATAATSRRSARRRSPWGPTTGSPRTAATPTTNEAVSGCADEPINVTQAAPELATTQEPASGVVGRTFKDKATVAGLFGAEPGGSIGWKLYDNGKCEDTPVASGRSGNRDRQRRLHHARRRLAAPAGTYYWVATYSGDANNNEAASGCADEPVTSGRRRRSCDDPGTGVGGRGRDVQGQGDDRRLFGSKPGGSIGWRPTTTATAKARRSRATVR